MPFEPAGGGVQFSRAVTTKGEVRPVTDPWTDADFENCYAEMSALEADFDKLIGLLKLPPMGWLVQNVDVLPRPTRRPHLDPPGSDWVPQPPPDAAG